MLDICVCLCWSAVYVYLIFMCNKVLLDIYVRSMLYAYCCTHQKSSITFVHGIVLLLYNFVQSAVFWCALLLLLGCCCPAAVVAAALHRHVCVYCCYDFSRGCDLPRF